MRRTIAALCLTTLAGCGQSVTAPTLCYPSQSMTLTAPNGATAVATLQYCEN